jgi:hypothetical protein
MNSYELIKSFIQEEIVPIEQDHVIYNKKNEIVGKVLDINFNTKYLSCFSLNSKTLLGSLGDCYFQFLVLNFHTTKTELDEYRFFIRSVLCFENNRRISTSSSWMGILFAGNIKYIDNYSIIDCGYLNRSIDFSLKEYFTQDELMIKDIIE